MDCVSPSLARSAPAERKQIPEYDLLRVLVTLMVVLGHSTYYYFYTDYGYIDYSSFVQPGLSLPYRLGIHLTSFLYTFHMPLYMALSGALMRLSIQSGRGYASLRELVTVKAKKLLIPFAAVTFFYVAPIKYLAGYYAASEHPLRDIWIGQFCMQGNTHLWFLPALFGIFIVIWLLEKPAYLPPRSLKLSLLYILSLASSRLFPHIVLLQNISLYAVWFYAGYCFEPLRPRLNRLLKRRSVQAGILAVFLASHAAAFCLSSMSAGKLLQDLCSTLRTAASCLAVYELSWLLSGTPLPDSPVFQRLRADSFGMYLYSDPLNYALLWLGTSLFGSAVFSTFLGSTVFYGCRSLGTAAVALLISGILRKCHLKYLY